MHNEFAPPLVFMSNDDEDVAIQIIKYHYVDGISKVWLTREH